MNLLILALSLSLAGAQQERREVADIAHVAPEPGRDRARAQVVEEVTAAWKRAGGARGALRLLVLDCDATGRVYKSELRQLFPEGVEHLPELLKARSIYRRTPNGRELVQYRGQIERGGFKFALFVEDAETDDAGRTPAKGRAQ